MKRRLLFPVVALIATVSTMAQTDITPKRYIFAEQQVGTYAVDEALPSANPINGYTPPVEKFNNGYIIINNGQFTSGLESLNAVAIRSGLSIVDLGGEVNKVLCIKGKNSAYPYGVSSTGVLGIAWWNMNFYTASTNVAKEQKIRFSIVFKVIENTPDLTDGIFAFDAYTNNGNNCFNPTLLRTTFKSGDFIKRYEDDDSPEEDENGNYIYNDDLWQKFEFDYQAGDEAGIPLRFTIAFTNQSSKFNNSTVLIKSITMLKDPIGEPKKGEIKLKWDPTSVGVFDTNKEVGNRIRYTCDGHTVKLFGIQQGKAVNVYTINGQIVSSFISNGSEQTVSLNNGFYIVKAGSEVTKVVVK